MNLIEVVDLLKEMVNNCSHLEGVDFLIAPSKVSNSMIDGYEIHMSGDFDEKTKKYLNYIALEKRLAIVQHPNSVMLYNAKDIGERR